jgi:hypothetical protein
MRTLVAFCALGASAFATAETTYLGLFMQGSKIGYSSYTSADDRLNGQPVKRNDSVTVMGTSLIGTALNIRIDSSTWLSSAGKPLRMKFSMASAGRSQNIDAQFRQTDVAIDIDNSGKKSRTVLPMPATGTVVDDPLTLVMNGGMAVGSTKSFYVLDPMTVSFIKNDVKLLGKSKVNLGGKEYDSTLVEIVDPRASMRVYLSAKGDLMKAESGMGIEMRPISREAALSDAKPGTVTPDLGFSTSITPSKKIENPRSVSRLRLKLTGRDLSNLRSDEHQTLRKVEDGWVLDIHPPRASAGTTVTEAARQKSEWLKPSLNIPSASPRFINLAKKIVGQRKDVKGAANAIRWYVYQTMKPNAGIGVLRNADEVLDTKEGVCRDYAILTATLLRAAKIPTRLASGMVYADGAFFYHAWAEVWDGTQWVGVDSTLPEEALSAVHVKLGDGNVDKAFTFTLLENAKIEVLSAPGK